MQITQEHTVDAYLRYREQFPKGQFRTDALRAIEHLEQEEEAWEKARKTNRISAYLAYLDEYADGKFTSEARVEIDKLRKTKAGAAAPSLSATTDKNEHLGQEEEAWDKAQKTNSISAYQAYLDEYTHGKFASKARGEIDKLRGVRKRVAQIASQKKPRQERRLVKVAKELNVGLSTIVDFLLKKGFDIDMKPTMKVSDEMYRELLKEFQRATAIKKQRIVIEDGLILIEGGSFLMGSNEDELEQPIHEVRVPTFFLGPYPVTFAEYDVFCEAIGANKLKVRSQDRDRRPVIDVSWEDAVDYCNWLSRRNGLSAAYDTQRNLIEEGNGYRLPSEAEWEYAARGGGESKGFHYAGGDYLDSVAWYRKNSSRRTQPVGQKNPNELGLYDMSGNVYEFTNDSYHRSYYSAPDNGSAWLKDGVQAMRVIRGGSWDDHSDRCRVTHRHWSYKDFHFDCFGFRVARSYSQ